MADATPTDFSTPARTLAEVRDAAAAVAKTVLAAQAEAVAEGAYPRSGLDALRDAGLWGLTAPKRVGGLGHGLAGLAAVTEELGKICPSTAMCFGMHGVATAVIAAKATKAQDERYLAPIAAGRHMTTLALSESGTGAHFYVPLTRAEHDGPGFKLYGTKAFVTNGPHADSMVASVAAAGGPGEFSLVVIDASDELRWRSDWKGLGMRGNASQSVEFAGVNVAADRLLGAQGDELWFVFEVVAPFFLTAMSGTYLGLSSGALSLAVEHVMRRAYAHSGERLAEQPSVQEKLGAMAIEVDKTRSLLYDACRLGDAGEPSALPLILGSKAAAGELAVETASQAMRICGGSAYRDNGQLARLLRDAYAANVMAPTTDLLKQWVGRMLLGEPLI